MAKKKTLADRLFYSSKRDYSRTDGSVAYLDATPLQRPTEMPRPQRMIVGVFVAIAIIIGIFIIKDTVISSLQATLLSEQTIASNLARPASIESIPQLADLIDLDDKEIVSKLQATGDVFYNSSEADENSGLTIHRIPSDIEVSEAAGYYRRGINTLKVTEATMLLNGAWTLTVDRSFNTSMIVRYADFTTGNPEEAIQKALVKEGFGSSSVTDSGMDDSNNTYSTGTIDVGDTKCIWKISAISLDDMYSIKGLPSNACYVGVRLTKTDEPASTKDE